MHIKFIINEPFNEVIKDCNNDQRLKIYDALFYYAETGHLPIMTELTKKFFIKLTKRIICTNEPIIHPIEAWNNFVSKLTGVGTLLNKLPYCTEDEQQKTRAELTQIYNNLDGRLKKFIGDVYQMYSYTNYNNSQLQIEKQQFLKFCKGE